MFKIHAPGIDTLQLNREILEKVSDRRHNPDEIRRIAELSFSPSAPSTTGFDPAISAELFETPVDNPDFAGRKFRFIKGPLRPLASFFFKLLSQVHDKLSENKIQAFYNVVHELIALDRRYQKLEERLSDVYLENLQLRNRLEKGNAAWQSLASSENGVATADDHDPIFPENELKNPQILDRLPSVGAGTDAGEAGALCIGDDSGIFSFEFRAKGYTPVLATTEIRKQARYIKERLGMGVLLKPAFASLLEMENKSLALISFPDLANSVEDPGALLEKAVQKLKSNGLLHFRWIVDPAHGAFRRTTIYELDIDALRAYAKELGLSPLDGMNASVNPEMGKNGIMDFIWKKDTTSSRQYNSRAI